MGKQREKTVTGRVLHDPVKDKLRPMFPLDLSKCRTVDELVRAMGDTAFTGRQIGDAADVFEQMARDKDCFVVMTLSGALTVGKMGLIFCDLIESGVVNAIVSTGALMAHGLVEATGYSHFRYNPNMGDKELFHAGYNRVYDSLEPETNLDHVEEVMDHIFKAWDAEDTACSWKIHRRIGEYLHKTAQGRGILKSAFEHNVPIFVPAFSDSELGIDFALHKIARQKDKRPLLRFDPFLDFEKFADTMLATRRMGILTIGGGVPRNWNSSADRQNSSSQLVAAVRRLRGAAGAARLQETSTEALQLWRADLPGAGPLGWLERKHVHGSSFLGKVCAAGRRRTFRGSVR